MALNSICPRCGHSGFEIAEQKVSNAEYRFFAIRCSSCGCVVGTHEYNNIGNLINKLADKLNINL